MEWESPLIVQFYHFRGIVTFMSFNPSFDADFSRGSFGEDLINSMPAMFQESKIEVKTDYRAIETGNFFVEYQQQNVRSFNWKPSGINVSTADYWAFVIPQNFAVYIISRKGLVELLRENWETYKHRSQPIKNEQTNAAMGILVPVRDLSLKMVENVGKI